MALEAERHGRRRGSLLFTRSSRCRFAARLNSGVRRHWRVRGMLSLNKIIVLNLALTLTHQVDAAYWRAWEMFGLPGGAQLFKALQWSLLLDVLAYFVPTLQPN